MFISHDLRVVCALSNHVIVMKDGKVVEEGSSSDVFERRQMPYTQALLAAALNLEVRHTDAIAD
jgi:microcin C transport system ATP-binding protein